MASSNEIPSGWMLLRNSRIKAIGLTGADSKEWQVQYALLKHLQHVVRDEGLTHAEVASRGGSSRTRVTAILIRLLGALGYRVKVSVTRVNTAA
jgi:hypothetical protein